MSDDNPNNKRPGKSDHDYLKRMTSPELRILDLIERLTARVTTGEAETKAKFDFVLEQQAQLTANVGQLAATVGSLSEKLDRTTGGITNLLAAAEIQAGEIRDLAASVSAVDERQRHADDRLNVLINTVERFISEGGKK